jgi:hypothetical protein
MLHDYCLLVDLTTNSAYKKKPASPPKLTGPEEINLNKETISSAMILSKLEIFVTSFVQKIGLFLIN